MDWRADALCARVGGDVFYPDIGESSAPAKRICHRCPVEMICREYAITENEDQGVWGGLSARQRRRERARRGLDKCQGCLERPPRKAGARLCDQCAAFNTTRHERDAA